MHRIDDDIDDDVAPIPPPPPLAMMDRDETTGMPPDWNSARGVTGRWHRRAAVTSCTSWRRDDMISSLEPGAPTLRRGVAASPFLEALRV